MTLILVVNAGSTSIKTALFDGDLTERAAHDVGGIGAGGPPDHAAALNAILDRLDAAPTVVGHRVVHGGADLAAPVRIDAAARATIAAQIPLAPLHNPVNLAAIDALAARMPDLPQTASFDTAFHATNPEVATTYALPAEWRDRGVRRYGFHGISYAGLVDALDPLPRRLLALHLGGGASLCAIVDGRSVATTMGYSPLSGLTMATRTGEIDGNAVLRIAEEAGIDGAARILNRESGLVGLGGSPDMRALEAAGTPEAAFAIDHFRYWAVRHGGSLIAAMGGVDALAFTGGIGENAHGLRDAIARGLSFAGRVPVHVVPADEERRIARDALTLLAD